MSQLEQAARLALEALDEFMTDYQSEDGMNSMKHYAKKHHAAITALRAALEQSASGIKQVIYLYDNPEQPAQQEPVAYVRDEENPGYMFTILHEHREQPEPVAKVCHDLPGHIGWNPKLTDLPDEGASLYIRPQQPAQDEPVAWQWLDTGNFRKNLPSTAERSAWRPLYTRPAERKLEDEPLAQAREPLKDEQRSWIVATCVTPRQIIDLVEKMHGIKGEA